jgi:DNA-binding beta-propeller fold protein YncE
VNPNENTIYAFDTDMSTSLFAFNRTDHKESTIDLHRDYTPDKSEPDGVAVNPNENTIYVFDYLYNNGTNISVINGTTNTLIDTIELKYEPLRMSFDSQENMLYVHSLDTSVPGYTYPDYIYLIDGTTNRMKGNLSLQMYQNVVASPETNALYGVKYDESSSAYSFSVINITTNEVVKSSPISISPFVIEANPNTDTVYAAVDYYGENASMLSIINGTTLEEQTIDLDYDIASILVDPNTNIIYVGAHELYANKYFILAINGTTNQIIDTIPVTVFPSHLSFGPNPETIYAASDYFDSDYTSKSALSVINITKLQEVKVIQMDHVADGITVNPATGVIYAANYELYGNSSVLAINTANQSIKNIPLDQRFGETNTDPYIPPYYISKEVAVDLNANTIYVSGEDRSAHRNSYLLAINGTTNNVIESVDIEPDSNVTTPHNFAPEQLLIDPSSRTIYVSGKSLSNNYLIAVNGTTNKVIESIVLEATPEKMIIDSESNRAFILTADLYYRDIMSLNTSNLEAGPSSPFELSSPIDISFDSEGNRLFVAHVQEQEDRISSSPLTNIYSVSVFDTKTYEELGNIRLEAIQELAAIHYDEKTDMLYALDGKTGSMSYHSANY